MQKNKFGFEVVSSWLPVMDDVIVEGVDNDGFVREISRLILMRQKKTTTDGPKAECACTQCAKKLAALWLLAGPAAGRGWKPGPLSSRIVCEYHDGQEVPEFTGMMTIPEPVETGVCDICGAAGPVVGHVRYQSRKDVKYVPSSEKRVCPWEGRERADMQVPAGMAWFAMIWNRAQLLYAVSGVSNGDAETAEDRIKKRQIFLKSLQKVFDLSYDDMFSATPCTFVAERLGELNRTGFSKDEIMKLYHKTIEGLVIADPVRSKKAIKEARVLKAILSGETFSPSQ